MNYKGYITSKLKDHLTPEQIEIVLSVVLELITPKEKDDSLSLLKYANKKFERRYGNESIFCFFPVSPQFLKYITNFRISRNLTGDKYRKYIDWLILMGEEKVGRLPMPKDLINSKLFSMFNSGEGNDIFVKKKRVQSKNILTAN